jgi:hypothetical protein
MANNNKANISKSIIENSMLLNDVDSIIWVTEDSEYLELIGNAQSVEEWKGEEQIRNCIILKDKENRYYRILNSNKSNIRKYINHVANTMINVKGTKWKVVKVSVEDSRSENVKGEFYKWELLGR